MHRLALVASDGHIITWLGPPIASETDAIEKAHRVNQEIGGDPLILAVPIRCEEKQRPLHRSKVYEALGIVGDTIPKDMAGTFYGVSIKQRIYKGNPLPYDGLWHGTVTVRPADGSYAKHRIFLHCVCGKLIPAGRIAQHRC